MRIIKRKKRKRVYFYLQHSFREGKKVMTKEKYLGKNIPQNIEATSLEFKKTFIKQKQSKFFKSSEKIKNRFQEEWQRYPTSMKEKLFEQVAIAFTYNTNAIEGSRITLKETRELIEHKIAPNKPINDIKESEKHVKVFLEMLRKKERLNQKLILKWHNELFGETKPDIAGKFRTYFVTVGGYITPDWRKVKSMMNHLINFYNKNKKQMNPVEIAARLHYKFEKIHPFGDGNGRVGRLLMNHVLWHNKYPIIIIEYKKRTAYYKALRNEEQFLNYFIRLYLKIHKKYLK